MDRDRLPLQSRLTPAGCLPAKAVGELLDGGDLTIENLIRELLPLAVLRSSAPLSNFAVGAVVEATSTAGQPSALYLGANLEFPGQVLGNTIHAEQSAVNNAWLHGEQGLRLIAVTAVPCGHCRQFLQELTTAETLDVLVANDSFSNTSFTKHSLANLLPEPFGPQKLGTTDRLMQAGEQPIKLETDDPLVVRATAAATSSYAPYSGNYAGVALRIANGQIVCGRMAENAAFNPTLSPMASALAALQLHVSWRTAEVIDAVLVEVEASISQQSHADSLLRSVRASAPPVRCFRIPRS